MIAIYEMFQGSISKSWGFIEFQQFLLKFRIVLNDYQRSLLFMYFCQKDKTIGIPRELFKELFGEGIHCEGQLIVQKAQFHYIRNMLILYYKKVEDLVYFVKFFQKLPIERVFQYMCQKQLALSSKEILLLFKKMKADILEADCGLVIREFN